MTQRTIDVVPYNPAWPQQFAEEAKRLHNALGNNCVEVLHIGSTAVPGLAAKPLIDLLPVVRDIRSVDVCNPAMEALGYMCMGEHGMLFRRFFQKGHGPNKTRNVHVFEQGNSEITRHALFRDWMRTHEDDKQAYAALKQHLAQTCPNDITAYCLGKSDFVTQIDVKTGFHGHRWVLALTDAEWAQYHALQYSAAGQVIGNDTHLPLVGYQDTQPIAAAFVKQEPTRHAQSGITTHHPILHWLHFNPATTPATQVTLRALLDRWLKEQHV
ncbi:MAG: GrpB family protein [Pseudomonadota bacterium]